MHTLDLTIGPWTLRLLGLTDAAAAVLRRRWGGFCGPAGPAPPSATVLIADGTDASRLPPWAPGEPYRMEADFRDGSPSIRSYHFELRRGAAGRDWSLAIAPTEREPLGRIFDNAARYLTARLAIEEGGVAMHGATVRRGERAWVFAGPSGSGKSTAVGLSAPAESMGDDFAVVLPHRGDWAACAVPFDNAERAPEHPVRGLVPLAGVWRLFQSTGHRVERPPLAIAHASILACAAFPWALPDLAERSGSSIASLAGSGKFAHLHFARDPGFWPLLEGGA